MNKARQADGKNPFRDGCTASGEGVLSCASGRGRFEALYELGNHFEVAGVEAFEILDQLPQIGRVGAAVVKKFLRRHAEIDTDREKDAHRGKTAFVVYIVDIVFALPEGKTHFPRGHALLRAQSQQPIQKKSLVIVFEHDITLWYYTTNNSIIYTVLLFETSGKQS